MSVITVESHLLLLYTDAPISNCVKNTFFIIFVPLKSICNICEFPPLKLSRHLFLCLSSLNWLLNLKCISHFFLCIINKFTIYFMGLPDDIFFIAMRWRMLIGYWKWNIDGFRKFHTIAKYVFSQDQFLSIFWLSWVHIKYKSFSVVFALTHICGQNATLAISYDYWQSPQIFNGLKSFKVLKGEDGASAIVLLQSIRQRK